MENIVEPNTTQAQPIPTDPTPTPSSKKWPMVVFFVLLGLIAIPGSVFAGIQIGKNQTPLQQDEVSQTNAAISPTISTTTPSVTTNPSTEWKTAKFGGIFSYEYPLGWNVAELWSENISSNGILIAIDPNPINTAPRGGPLATFEIVVYNGNQNPDELLAEKISAFNEDSYSDITKETIEADIGDVYHYKGKVKGEMYNGESFEKYFFTFNRNPNDLINQQVVVATLAFNDDPQMSQMLQHIVLSFKDLI